jgi:MFS family permease
MHFRAPDSVILRVQHASHDLQASTKGETSVAQSEAVQKDEYTQSERNFVTWSAILGYGFDFYNLIIFAFLMGPVQHTLGMSLPQAGLIVSSTLASSVLGGVAIGWVGDLIGRKNALLASLALLAGGSILSAFAWNFESLLAFRTLAGIGVGGEWGAGMVLLNEVWRSHGRGAGSGLVQAMSAAGTAMAVVVATFCLSYFSEAESWRAAMLFGGVPVFLMIFVRSKMPESRLWQEFDRLRKAGALPEEKRAERTPIVEVFRGASLRYFILGMLMCGAYIIAYQAVNIFMPMLIMKKMGGTPDVVRAVTLLWCIALAVGMWGAGHLSDRVGRKRAVVGATALSILGFAALMAFGRTPYPGSVLGWSLLWCYLLWGLGQGSIGIFGPWFSELFPVELRSTGTSVTFTAGRLVGAVMPYLVPIIAAQMNGDLFGAMMCGVAGAVLCLVFALCLPETAGRRFAVIEGKERLSAAA